MALEPHTAHSIPLGAHFQFRNPGAEPLAFVIVTMPPWPGMDEAMRVADHWPQPPPAGSLARNEPQRPADAPEQMVDRLGAQPRGFCPVVFVGELLGIDAMLVHGWLLR